MKTSTELAGVDHEIFDLRQFKWSHESWSYRSWSCVFVVNFAGVTCRKLENWSWNDPIISHLSFTPDFVTLLPVGSGLPQETPPTGNNTQNYRTEQSVPRSFRSFQQEGAQLRSSIQWRISVGMHDLRGDWDNFLVNNFCKTLWSSGLASRLHYFTTKLIYCGAGVVPS